MGVLEDAMLKAKAAADYVGNKTGEIVEISRLRMAAAEIEGKIEKEFAAMGRAAYAQAKETAETDEGAAGENSGIPLGEKIGAIDALKSELKDLNAKIAELQRRKTCAACGTVNVEDANFCYKCGAKL
jgi:hypothetical protein